MQGIKATIENRVSTFIYNDIMYHIIRINCEGDAGVLFKYAGIHSKYVDENGKLNKMLYGFQMNLGNTVTDTMRQIVASEEIEKLTSQGMDDITACLYATDKAFTMFPIEKED